LETVRASFSWSGPDDDRLYAFVEPFRRHWIADSVDGPDPSVASGSVFVLWELDRDPDELGPGDEARETGRVAGIEMLDFLRFDRWDELPTLPMLWQLPGWEPLPLDEMLKRKHREIVAELTAAGHPAVAPAAARRL
jgi:hypothetical protein